MKKILSRLNILIFVFSSTGLSWPLNATSADAGNASTVDETIEIRTDSIVRNIEGSSIGAGLNYHLIPTLEACIREIKCRDDYRSLHLSLWRWPAGVTGQLFIWDHPDRSYRLKVVGSGNGQIADLGQVKNLARENGAHLLVQLNTFRFFDPKRNAVVRVKSSNIEEAASSIRRFIESADALGGPPEYWEIGNEDWSDEDPEQYAAIVRAYARAIRSKAPNAFILAQGLTGRWKAVQGSAWTNAVISSIGNDVDGLSLHAYLSGLIPGKSASLSEQIQNLFAQTANGLSFINEADHFKKPDSGRLKLWVTEFNILQRTKRGDEGIAAMQNVGHALVLGDWMGVMLYQGVDKLFIHSLLGNPNFALLASPRSIKEGGELHECSRFKNLPALMVSIYAQYFQGDLLAIDKTVRDPNLNLTGQFINKVRQVDLKGDLVSENYDKVGAYAIRRPDKSIVMLLINRDVRSPVTVQIRISDRNAHQISLKSFAANLRLDDTARTVCPDKLWRDIDVDALKRPLVVAPHSAVLLTAGG